MNQIIVFGAGRSSLFLIEYLGAYAAEHQMQVLVCDRDVSYASRNLEGLPATVFMTLDIDNEELVSQLIGKSVIVVSLLPAILHIRIAGICLRLKKHLATASYISDEMKAMNEEVKDKGLIFLNEMGLDPGIDHMSAMQMMAGIRAKGGRITGFKSYCGGLVADEDDGDNPWKYKFSWNPRNVVLAAQGAPATFLESGNLKQLPYHRVFENPVLFELDQYGRLEAYPNRDSLKYCELYGLHDLKDMLRGTFRKPGYCKAWQVFVTLGMTDDQHIHEFPEHFSKRDFLKMFLPADASDIKTTLKSICHCSDEEISKIEWLGFLSDELILIRKGSSAQVLEEILKQKWKLEEGDRDLIVMLHEITYELNAEKKKHIASMVLKGETNVRTAMARTVGMPLAIGCRLILENKISERGVIAPVFPDIYNPVLEELKNYGVNFSEVTA